MKTIGYLIPVLLVFSHLVLAGESDKTAPGPALEPSEYIWDYGFIPKDAWVCHHYNLTNNHPDTITILEMIPGCDCTHAPKRPIVIPPGESRLMKILFDTRTYIDETNRSIHLVTDHKENPEFDLYFGSIVGRAPKSAKITPPSTVFIQGKESQTFLIENILDEKTRFTVLIDSDSCLEVSETEFEMNGVGRHELKVSPVWDRLPPGSHHRCLVIEINRDRRFRMTIPIKINKF